VKTTIKNNILAVLARRPVKGATVEELFNALTKSSTTYPVYQSVAGRVYELAAAGTIVADGTRTTSLGADASVYRIAANDYASF
jgi:hypothetical protein